MKIETPLPKTNHNVSTESDGYRFLRYVGFFIFFIFSFYVFFIALSYILVSFISIEKEQEWFWSGSIEGAYTISPLPEVLQERYKNVSHTIRVIDMDIENAFADLWGNVYITQSLIDEMDYFEELDFIVGHELWHVEERHVLRGIISDLPLTFLLTLFWGEYGSTIFQWILGNTYSKYHETVSDRSGLDFTYELNWHVWCALDFFDRDNTIGTNILEIFSTHPMSDFRIKRAKKYAEKMWYEQWECRVLSL